MNLLTETGQGILAASGEPVELDGLPLNQAARTQESYDLIARAWTNRPVEGLSYTRGIYVLTFVSAPVLLANGIEAVVSLTQNGNPVTIDGTRHLINPPLIDRDGIDSREWYPEFAIVEALIDSIVQVPGG